MGGTTMKRIIQYCIDNDTGYVYSRVGGKMAIPIIDFDDMGPEDNFAIKAHLDFVSAWEVPHHALTYTRKIPVDLKNLHRKFWGMAPVLCPKEEAQP
jgi:hypothetical protein